MHLHGNRVFPGVQQCRIKCERIPTRVAPVGGQRLEIDFSIGRHPETIAELLAVQVKHRAIIDVVRDARRRRPSILRHLKGCPEIIGHLPPLVVHRCAKWHFQFVVLMPQRTGAAGPTRVVEIDRKPIPGQLRARVLKTPFMI